MIKDLEEQLRLVLDDSSLSEQEKNIKVTLYRGRLINELKLEIKRLSKIKKMSEEDTKELLILNQKFAKEFELHHNMMEERYNKEFYNGKDQNQSYVSVLPSKVSSSIMAINNSIIEYNEAKQNKEYIDSLVAVLKDSGMLTNTPLIYTAEYVTNHYAKILATIYKLQKLTNSKPLVEALKDHVDDTKLNDLEETSTPDIELETEEEDKEEVEEKEVKEEVPEVELNPYYFDDYVPSKKEKKSTETKRRTRKVVEEEKQEEKEEVKENIETKEEKEELNSLEVEKEIINNVNDNIEEQEELELIEEPIKEKYYEFSNYRLNEKALLELNNMANKFIEYLEDGERVFVEDRHTTVKIVHNDDEFVRFYNYMNLTNIKLEDAEKVYRNQVYNSFYPYAQSILWMECPKCEPVLFYRNSNEAVNKVIGSNDRNYVKIFTRFVKENEQDVRYLLNDCNIVLIKDNYVDALYHLLYDASVENLIHTNFE